MNTVLGVKDSVLMLAIQMLLDEQPGLSVAGAANDPAGLSALVRVTVPDLIIVDWELGSETIAQLLKENQQAARPAAIIILASDPQLAATGMAYGADAFVLKGNAPAELVQTVRRLRDVSAGSQH